jgi:quinol---cytochrome c reductase iron-sulfur subunit, bacillus type
VRWFPESGLFMCPCHGGVYYADGEHASGPPPRGLYQYDYKIDGDQLLVQGGRIPTLSEPV